MTIHCHHCEYEGESKEFGFKEGKHREIPDEWTCPKCGKVSYYAF